MSRCSVLLFLFLMILYSGIQLYAQETVNPDSSLQNILSGHKGTPLSLQQAIQYALDNATSIQIAKASYMAAEGAVRREKGYFDPDFFFDFDYLKQNIPSASFFAGASVLKTQETNYQTGLRLKLPVGTELELSLNSSKLQTNSSFAFLNPENDAFGNLTIRQPLLNGFSASARENLSLSERNLEAQKALYNQQVIFVSSETEQLYWDLYAIERNYAVQQLTRDQAQSLLKDTESRANSGLVGPNQVANARTFLAQQDLLLIDREEQFDSQSDQLSTLIGLRPEQGMQHFIPTDSPPKDFFVEDVDVLVQQAIKNNLSLKAAQHNIEAVKVQLVSAKWKVLPKLDLVGSLGANGLTGSPQNVIFSGDTLRSSRNGSFYDALSQVSKRQFPVWSIGVDLSIPIGLRTGLGEKDRLQAEFYGTQQRYHEISRVIEEQVRTYWRELFHGKKRLEAATKAVEAAQEQVRIGLIEFHNGRSTAFELVRLGADFASAQQSYSEALVRTAKARALLKQLTSGVYTGITQ